MGESKIIYQNRHITLREDRVSDRKGKEHVFAVASVNSGAAVLPMDEEGNVYLVKQFRYALGKDSIEIPGGGLDSQEKPLDIAKRELLEELGIKALQWIHLGFVNSLTSTVVHREDLFLARGLEFHTPSPDETEELTMVKMKFSEAVKLVMQSHITHGPSCVLILKTNEFLRSRAEIF